MKNCIIHCFKNIQNHTIEINQFDIVDEVDYFSFCLESDFELKESIILLTDIPIKIILVPKFDDKFWYVLDYNSVKEYFKSQDFNNVDFYFKEFELDAFNRKIWFYKIFINYPIGLCDIVLFDNLTQKSVKSFYLNIVSSKIDENEFSSLVSYVENKGNSIWAKHSLLKHTAERFDDEDKMEWMLTFSENFIEELNSKYLNFFSFDKIKIIRPKNEVVDFSLETNTSEDSLFWLINNLDVLQPTTSQDNNRIIIKNRLFAPLEILSAELKEDTDTNENQIIHGFISELTRFLNNCKFLFEDEIKKCSKNKFEELIKFYSYSRSINRLNRLLKNLTQVKYYLNRHIPVKFENLEYLNTNKIESKEHYNFVYSGLIEWLLYKDATFSKNKKLFKGINRMDQLFERACFYKLIDSFEKLDFEFENIDFDRNNFPTKVRLTKKGIVHYLYSQVIPDKLITVKQGSGNLKPDFVIELENEKYIVIDAKYKKIKNVSKFDYPELSLKYLHGIGYKGGGYFNPLGLFVLFPDKNKIIDFYQKREFNLFSDTPVFPVIGSISVNFEEESILLNSSIKKLLEGFS